MANTITSANSTFQLLIPQGSFGNTPQQLQGYATDDAFDGEEMEIAQAEMGVDGIMSAGYTPVIEVMSVHLQAASASIEVFDQWYADMKAAEEVLFASAIINAPSLGKEWTFQNGVLVKYKPLPAAKKMFQSQTFGIKWESVSVAAI